VTSKVKLKQTECLITVTNSLQILDLDALLQAEN